MSRTKHAKWPQSTPAWWTRIFMTRPQRAAAKRWERKAIRAADIEEIDSPPHGKKPHKYYW